MIKDRFTTRQVSSAIGVSEASLKRWCDQGFIPSMRTGGGHRRIPLAGVIQFLRRTGQPLIQPELIGMPRGLTTSSAGQARAMTDVREALEGGHEHRFRQVAYAFYLKGMSACEIFDQILATAFHEIGDRWAHRDTEIYQERRACEICLRWIHELRGLLPEPQRGAPMAIGGAPAGDLYQLAAVMAEAVLREAGWIADTLGSNLPFDTLGSAVRDIQPRLCWLSVSHIPDEREFLKEYDVLYEDTHRRGIGLAVGGRALTEQLRRHMRYSAYCDQLQHLVSFADTLNPEAQA